MSQISFTAFATPQPQGSVKAFMIGGKPRLTTDNSKLKPFRSEVTRCAMMAMRDASYELPMAGKHVPVEINADFFFAKPESIGKKRLYPSVKPDVDKICRSLLDSMTGVAFHDDAQVIAINARKHYGMPERVEVTVTTI
jgi:Holliday junction resolvase RusA-like endonuclease